MSHLAANLAALERYHPGVASRIATVVRSPQGAWSTSRSGVPTVRLGDRALTSAFDPVSEATKAVPEWKDPPDFAVLIGLGAGYLAEAMAVRYPDLPIVVAEEDPAWFAEVLVHRDLSALWSNPWIVPLLGPGAETVGDFLRPLACHAVELIPWRPLAHRLASWGAAVADQVAQAQTQAGVNLATFRRFGAMWLRNLAKNEAHVREVRPVAALAGWASGLPAVVAAAGPGLADSFSWMRRYRQRFVLIAVDTAWTALAAQGFEPDVLVVLDGQYWNARHVDRTPPDRTVVVTEWIGPPRAFRLAPGRTYVAASSVPMLRSREVQRWGDMGVVPSGGSVATAAWSLALHLGCTQVAFAGLDLGYPQGLTHVPGSQFEEAIHRRSGRLGPAETLGLGLRGQGLIARPAVDGGEIPSDARMDLFRRWLSLAVGAHPKVKAVNLGRRGTVVPGLLPPSPDYGEAWPEVRLPPLVSKPLVPRPAPPVPPAFDALRRVLSSTDVAWTEVAWTEARTAWGASAWDTWAGRAKTTWDRWPSARSRRAIEEVVRLALEWETFWKLP